MNIFYTTLALLIAFTCAACTKDDGVDPKVAESSCNNYCEKRFECGVTTPAGKSEDYYKNFCKNDCFEQLVNNKDAEFFEMPSNCCVIDCDNKLSCSDWSKCCDSC